MRTHARVVESLPQTRVIRLYATRHVRVSETASVEFQTTETNSLVPKIKTQLQVLHLTIEPDGQLTEWFDVCSEFEIDDSESPIAVRSAADLRGIEVVERDAGGMNVLVQLYDLFSNSNQLSATDIQQNCT